MKHIIVCILSLFFSFAIADSCPESEITIEFGSYIITASDLTADNAEQILENACLEFNGWTLSGKRLVFLEGYLSGKNIEVIKGDIHGDIQEISGSKEIKLIKINLSSSKNILPTTFSIKSDAYKLEAGQGTLNEAGIIIIEQAKIIGMAKNNINQIYKAENIEISDRIKAENIFYSNGQISFSGEKLEKSDQKGEIFGVYINLCRDVASKSLGISAEQVAFDGFWVVKFPEINVNILNWQVPFKINDFNVQLGQEFEFPWRFSINEGLIIGFERLLIDKNFDLRLTLIKNKLFTVKNSFLYALEGQKNGISFSINQLDKPLKVDIKSDPSTGLSFLFTIDTDWNGEQGNKPYEESAFGFAKRWQFGMLGTRLKFELGESWQDKLLAFARGTASFGLAFQLGALGFDGFSLLKMTYFSSGEFNWQLNGGFNAKLLEKDFSVRLGASFNRDFGPLTFPKLSIDQFIRVNFGIELKPELQKPPLGYLGLALEQPEIDLELQSDFYPSFVWRKKSIDLSFKVAFYNNRIQKDGLDQYFQTPIFSISPRFYYDWATLNGYRYGEFGAKITFNDCCLGWNLSIYRTIKDFATVPTTEFGWKVFFDVNLI